MAGLWATRDESLDGQLCPRESGPSREVILLLDTSDPLSEKHRAEFRRILREMTSHSESGRHSALAMRKGERVSVYLLEGFDAPASPLVQICHPGGDPDEQTSMDTLTKGGLITEWRFEQFVRVLEDQFPDEQGDSQPESPILETIATITARHAPSRRAFTDTAPAHVIVFSDLLQHTAMLSHYGGYPLPSSLPRELAADLSRAEVSLFRLERQKYEKYQSAKHYYWWSDWIEAMGGQVIWQQSL